MQRRMGRGGADHPRVSGEHCLLAANRSWSYGSSPRERGALTETQLSSVADGIIPA